MQISDQDSESFQKSLHALAYNALKGNQWPSNRFSTDTNYRGDMSVSNMNRKVAKPSVYFCEYDTELAAQLYYEAALIVIGPDHAMKHPKPAEKIYLSKATKEQLKQHAGEEGDVAVFQKKSGSW